MEIPRESTLLVNLSGEQAMRKPTDFVFSGTKGGDILRDSEDVIGRCVGRANRQKERAAMASVAKRATLADLNRTGAGVADLVDVRSDTRGVGRLEVLSESVDGQRACRCRQA